jgi:hypothetical protein
MREIKFRGIRVDNGEWVIGFLTGSPHEDTCYILPQYDWETKYEVEPESVSKYTGLKDKNGVEIYDGDKPMSDFDTLKDMFDAAAVAYTEEGEDYGMLITTETTLKAYYTEFRFNPAGWLISVRTDK